MLHVVVVVRNVLRVMVLDVVQVVVDISVVSTEVKHMELQIVVEDILVLVIHIVV